MDIKDQVKNAYEKLRSNYKTRAANIYGVTPNYFQRIVNGEPKEKDVYYLALNAIKQAAKEDLEEAIKTVKNIEVITEEVKNELTGSRNT